MKFVDELTNKEEAVILRCDFNVSILNGKIIDNTKIKASIKTIDYLISLNKKIIILSHLNKIKDENDLKTHTLKPIAKELSFLINRPIHFFDNCYGEELKDKIKTLSNDSVILLENTRHMDFYNNLESNNDPILSDYWASLGDVFVFDAFATSHRIHASTTGISLKLPTYFGFLVKEELEELNTLLENQESPFTIFMGGSKIETKLPVIKKLLPICDYMLFGGGILNSFLKSTGYDIKDSLSTKDENIIKELKELIKLNKEKIMMTNKVLFSDNKIMDINVMDYKQVILNSKTIFVNGTPGVYEDDLFSQGTKDLFSLLDQTDAKVILGGGDILSASKLFLHEKSFNYYSTGGGATLSYLTNKKMIFFKKH